METAAYLALAAVLNAPQVDARYTTTCPTNRGSIRCCCYDNGTCYRGSCGMSTGARIGIGIGVAAAVILLFAVIGAWRRKQIANKFKQYKPPPPGGNNFAHNPPPPTYATGGTGTAAGGQSYPGGYGSSGGVTSPPAAYQPSTANQYSTPTGGAAAGYYGNDGPSYEYEQQQAMDAEKLAGSGGFAPPSGPPPGAGAAPAYSPPSGPPPGSKN